MFFVLDVVFVAGFIIFGLFGLVFTLTCFFPSGRVSKKSARGSVLVVGAVRLYSSSDTSNSKVRYDIQDIVHLHKITPCGKSHRKIDPAGQGKLDGWSD